MRGVIGGKKWYAKENELVKSSIALDELLIHILVDND